MITKTKMSKVDRKLLEREVIRNHKQRKENKKDINRLHLFYILERANALFWRSSEDNEDINNVNLRKAML